MSGPNRPAAPSTQSEPSPLSPLSPLKRALLALDEMKAKVDALQNRLSEPIAVIGIGCRFPGAKGPDDLWRLLRQGVDAVGEIPATRWDVDAFYDPNPDAAGKISTRWAACLDDVDRFEPQFFDIAPREAAGMDPQQRLLLEIAWEALEHAAQAPDRLAQTATGVFLGMCTSDYATLQTKFDDPARIDAYTASGGAHSVAAGRLSYVFGLQGPSITVDTACSSSLVAVHLACQSLRLQECRMALAGGVHLMLAPDNAVAFSRSRMLAADGRCKTFDASADGFVEGEGCGLIVLKRLSDAIADKRSRPRRDPRISGESGRAKQRADGAQRAIAGGRRSQRAGGGASAAGPHRVHRGARHGDVARRSDRGAGSRCGVRGEPYRGASALAWIGEDQHRPRAGSIGHRGPHQAAPGREPR